MPGATVIVDYQNIHLTGHGLWCPTDEPVHLCLIHPLHYANAVVRQRNLIKGIVARKNDESFEPVKLTRVVAFRGMPSNKQEPRAYQRSQSQKSEWTKNDRSEVVYRPLKYQSKNGRMVPQEKGIDVLVALELVQVAAQIEKSTGDVVILAAHDTDQEPALELAHRLAGSAIETTGWRERKRLRVPGAETWHTFLDEQDFINVRDPKSYA